MGKLGGEKAVNGKDKLKELQFCWTTAEMRVQVKVDKGWFCIHN